MFEYENNVVSSFKKHIKKHRAKYATLGTASLFLMLMNRNARVLNDFFEEHGIDPDEYYLPEN